MKISVLEALASLPATGKSSKRTPTCWLGDQVSKPIGPERGLARSPSLRSWSLFTRRRLSSCCSSWCSRAVHVALPEQRFIR